MQSLRERESVRAAGFAWLALAAAALPTGAAERSVEIWEGESASISAGRRQVERGTVTVKSDAPKIATASWGGGDNGPVIIAGVKEGKTLVTVKGKVRLVKLGIKPDRSRSAVLGSEDFTDYVNVTVVKAKVENRVIRLHKSQKMTIDLSKGARTRSFHNSNKKVVGVNRNMTNRFTLIGKKVGFSLVTVKFTRLKEGKKVNVLGLIHVTVYDTKREGPRIKKDSWLAMPEPTHKIIIVDPDKKVSRAPTWPPEGVKTAFIPSGRNYGDIGDLVIKNTTGKPIAITIPPGALLDSSDPAVQDLYVADVPTETPCEGAKDIDKPITLQPGETRIVTNLPGFCPDFEKAPPKKDDTAVYACKQPDEKSKALLDTIAAVKKLDVGELKLDVFGEKKARAMVAQGSLWTVDSHVDDEDGNEVADKDLTDRFYGAFTRSAKAALDKMPPETRAQAEKLVKDDIKKIVAATSFLAKQQVKNEAPAVES